MGSNLTAEQRSIAEADVAARIVVTAGPGTGKTHTLIARLVHLVDDEELRPSEILVLSFSRAAVGEIRRRLKETEARYVTPLTFDSFATRLLAEVDPNGAWTEHSYDGRIVAAIELLSESSIDLSHLEEVTHLCVDEIQDLVGVRREFVEVLIRRLARDGFGFTLLGDPAQGIYDFQLGSDGDPETDGSPALYRFLRADADAVEVVLERNHRAQSESTKVGLFAGPVLRDPAGNHAEVREMLERAAGSLPLVGIQALSGAVGASPVGVLCRTNGEALVVSRELDGLGVEHRLQRQATDRCVQPWVGRVLLSLGDRSLVRSKWETCAPEVLPGISDAEIEDRWTQLRRVGGDGRTVSLRRVSERLRRGLVPDDLQSAPTENIVVSTIHRAKGLEFDRVLIVDRDWRRDDEDDSEEARVLFVGLIRATRQLMRLELPGYPGRLWRSERHDRWAIHGYRRWMRWGFEIQPGDIDPVLPPGFGVSESDPEAVQELLASELDGNTELHLDFLREEGGFARYLLYVAGQPTGITTERFGWALKAEVRTSRTVRWPMRLSGLRLDGAGSVGGDPNTASACGLGNAAGWLVPRPVGMARIEWSL
ncbi:MAG: UvrD-helicase domain-containing protein [Microthrixaceae bacterium]